ncbi:MAG TPA: hypothetical protein VK615_17285 [Candidatus Binatia bacterium]|nr:hypothetical protein [Candidatus Binatia bacterium]
MTKDAQGVQHYTPRARRGEGELKLALIEPDKRGVVPAEEKKG